MIDRSSNAWLCVICRYVNPQSSGDVINGSKVTVTMDETNQQIVMTLKAKIIMAYQNITDGLKKQGTCELVTVKTYRIYIITQSSDYESDEIEG